jgi:hypothetical protein
MPRVCSICAHAQTASISKDIANGVPYRDISSRYNVSSAGAHRHATQCLRVRRTEPGAHRQSAPRPPRPSKRATSRLAPKGDDAEAIAFDANDPESIIATTARLVDRALELMESSHGREALQALREVRETITTLAKLTGRLGDGGSSVTVNVGGPSSALASLSIDELRALAALGVDQAPVIALPAQGDDARTC